ILDIGCGCGIIIDQLAQQYPGAQLLGSDVSHLAISSTVQNNPYVTAHRSASLSFAAPESLDLIVTNPPFHDGHRNAIGPTLQLFQEAKEKLTANGFLVIVANRHLNYTTHLDRLFTEVIEIATNKKFVIYRCAKA
ncbi:MAG: methyltransferase, partial [Bacteroidota bacterium]